MRGGSSRSSEPTPGTGARIDTILTHPGPAIGSDGPIGTDARPSRIGPSGPSGTARRTGTDHRPLNVDRIASVFPDVNSGDPPAGPAGPSRPSRSDSVRASLHRDALGQVARLVDVAAAQARDVIGEELQRDDGDERL